MFICGAAGHVLPPVPLLVFLCCAAASASSVELRGCPRKRQTSGRHEHYHRPLLKSSPRPPKGARGALFLWPRTNYGIRARSGPSDSRLPTPPSPPPKAPHHTALRQPPPGPTTPVPPGLRPVGLRGRRQAHHATQPRRTPLRP